LSVAWWEGKGKREIEKVVKNPKSGEKSYV
jgi:hypothetical protein